MSLCLCTSKQEQRINKCGCSGVPDTIELSQAIKWNTHSYPVWVQGKKTGNEAENRIDDADRICMKQELQTCWSRWTLVGLESDSHTVHYGNWICEVLSRVKETVDRHEMGHKYTKRVPCAPWVMKTWTAHWCTGKPNKMREKLSWENNATVKIQCFLQNSSTTYIQNRLHGHTNHNSIIYCVTRNMKKIEQRKIQN